MLLLLLAHLDALEIRSRPPPHVMNMNGLPIENSAACWHAATQG